MRVGIDIQNLRMDRRGIYVYIWNLIEQFCRMDDFQLKLFLYGDRWMDESAQLAHLAKSIHLADVVHYWDEPLVHLPTHHVGTGSPRSSARLIGACCCRCGNSRRAAIHWG